MQVTLSIIPAFKSYTSDYNSYVDTDYNSLILENELTNEDKTFLDLIIKDNQLVDFNRMSIAKGNDGVLYIGYINENGDINIYSNDFNFSDMNSLRSTGNIIKVIVKIYKAYDTGKTICKMIRGTGFDACGYLKQALKYAFTTQPAKYEVTRYFVKKTYPYPPHPFQCDSEMFGYWKTSYRKVY